MFITYEGIPLRNGTLAAFEFLRVLYFLSLSYTEKEFQPTEPLIFRQMKWNFIQKYQRKDILIKLVFREYYKLCLFWYTH